MEDIAIFLICISVIEIILPSGSFANYIRLFLGVVFIVVLLMPLKNHKVSSSIDSFNTNSKINIDTNQQENIANETYEDMLKTQIQNNILQMASNKNIEVTKVDIEFETATQTNFVINDITITVKNAKEKDLVHLKNLIFEVYSGSLKNINFVYDSK